MARFQEQFGFRTTSGDTGAAAASNNLASRLGGFAGSMLQQHQQNRISDAQEDAAMADPREGELVNKKTVYGQQYNETLIKAHQAAVKSGYSLTLERFANESPNNPVEFKKKVDSIRDSTLKQAIPETRQMLEIGFDNLSGSYLNKIAAKSKADFTKAAITDEKIGLQASLDDMMRFARNGDDKSAADEFFGYSAMVGASDYSEAKQRELIGSAKRGLLEQTYLDDLEDMPAEDAMAKLQDLSKDIPKSHTVDEWETFVSKGRQMVVRNKAIAAGKQAEATSLEKSYLSNFLDARKLGMNTSPEEVTKAREIAIKLEKLPELQSANDVAAIALLPASDRSEVISALKGSGVENASTYRGAIAANQAITRQIKDKGVAFYAEQFPENPLPPFDLSESGVKARESYAQAASGHYGSSLSIFSPAEADLISEQISASTPNEKSGIAAAFKGHPEVWSQLADKQQLVFAVGAAHHDQGVTAAMFKGQDLLDRKLVDAVKPDDALAQFLEATGDIYDGVNLEAHLKAAKAHYYSKGLAGDLDWKAFEASIQSVTGGIGDLRGQKIELPPGVDIGKVESYFDMFDSEWIAEMGGAAGFTDEQAAERVRGSQIKSVGSNQYQMAVPTDGGYFETLISNETGKPMIFSFDPIREEIYREAGVQGFGYDDLSDEVSEVRGYPYVPTRKELASPRIKSARKQAERTKAEQ